AWVDRQGKEVESVPAGENLFAPVLSPDGKRAVAAKRDAGGAFDLLLLDLIRGKASRFTFDPRSETRPGWAPDGNLIVYSLPRKAFDLYIKNTDGLGEPELLLESAANKYASDWTRDGKWILYVETAGVASEIWALPTTGDRKPVPLVPVKTANLGVRVS